MTDTRWAEVRASHGVVATPHRLASEAGLATLRSGGNAIDAAVAAAATIAVVYPHMNGIGGDSFWLVHDGRARRLRGLAAAGRAATAATLDTYGSRYRTAIPARGGQAALTVPGTVAGWWEAHRFSRDALGSPLTWPALLDAAITHARNGFPVSAGQRRVTALARDLFEPGAPEEVRRTLWPRFHPDRLGTEPFRQPEIARTLIELAADGGDALYRGALAKRLVAGAMEAGSPLREPDLAAHHAEWVEPLRVPYRGGEAASFPPPTQGMSALAILALLDAFDVARLDDADRIHVTVEATKIAFEDRNRWLTDPAVVDVPVAECLDLARLAERRRRIDRERAMSASAVPAAGDTIAIVTADRAGHAVCVIQSIYHEFGAGIVAGDTGVILQNRGAFFSLDPAHPNCLAPGKRTAHTLIPSMWLVGGAPRLVYGTMGGEGQPQTQAALVMGMVDRDLGPQAAVEAPRWLYGRTWGESTSALRIEGRFDATVADTLRRRGHEVVVVDDWSDLMGHAQAIRIDADGLRAGSDPRADGAALGW